MRSSPNQEKPESQSASGSHTHHPMKSHPNAAAPKGAPTTANNRALNKTGRALASARKILPRTAPGGSLGASTCIGADLNSRDFDELMFHLRHHARERSVDQRLGFDHSSAIRAEAISQILR